MYAIADRYLISDALFRRKILIMVNARLGNRKTGPGAAALKWRSFE